MRIKLLNTALCLLFTAAGLHAQETDYGAGAANVRFIPSQGLLGGRTDFDCLRLKTPPAASGVPLGGIGAGNVQFAPDGRFVRIGMNNIHLPIRKSTGSFFTLWHRNGGTADARRCNTAWRAFPRPITPDCSPAPNSIPERCFRA